MVVKYLNSNIDIKNKAMVHFGELFVVVLPYLKKPVSAEYISKQIRIKPSKIRAVLNKLFNHNLIEYKRSFDDDTGKYTYIWTLKQDKLKTFLKNYNFETAVKADVVETDVSAFFCVSCKETYDYDSASDCSFKCYKCGSTIDANEKQAIARASAF
jgi:transcription factor E